MSGRTEASEFASFAVNKIFELCTAEGVIDPDEAVFLAQAILITTIRDLCHEGVFSRYLGDEKKVIH